MSGTAVSGLGVETGETSPHERRRIRGKVLPRVEVLGVVSVPAVEPCSDEEDLQRRHAQDEGYEVLEREILESAREAAREEGFRAGYRDGREQAMGELRGLVGALETVRRGLENSRAEMLRELEREITALALEIAEKLALQEITANPEAVRNLVRRVIERAGEKRSLRVRLSPEDCRRLREGRKELLASLVEVGDLDLVEDESLSVGDCVVETSSGIVDARLERRVERVRSSVMEGEDADG
ncbi:MAG: hypothetical protein H5T74_06710 [Actinobacteria bacterium]|nr:hypothetical protein [Actinomycetota bacterium]